MKFNVEVEMPERWVPHFIGFLKHLERNGQLGHSSIIGFYADGDGDFRPTFNCNIDSRIAREAGSGLLKVEALYDAG